MEQVRFVWLHGFASGPTSGKGRYVRDRLGERGLALDIPDLNEPAFRSLTVTRMLSRVGALAGQGKLVLFGSSLGGFTAATFAARNPDRVEALVLLAPAFDLSVRWQARMPEGDLDRWRKDGVFAFDHHMLGRKEPLAIGFLDDAARYEPFPLPRAPTLVLQGTKDEVVEPQLAREFERRMAGRARLVELPDGHELCADLPRLWLEISGHLAPWLRPVR